MAVVASKRSVMTMYSDPQSAYSHRVRIVLAEKNITVDVADVDPRNLSEDLLDLNPYGTLPTLVDRELVLYESGIIMQYLDERYPHPPLLPVDPVSRAQARQLMYRVDRDWYLLAGRIRNPAVAAEARKQLGESLTAAAPVFAAKPFFMSDDLGLVDCYILPLLWRLPMLGVTLPPQAHAVEEYAERLFQRESFRHSLTEIEREMRG
jgi:stringent starvation protein A